MFWCYGTGRLFSAVYILHPALGSCYSLSRFVWQSIFKRFIDNSFRSLPYDKSIAFSKASSPQSAIWCFLFKLPVFSRFPEGELVAAYVFFLVFPRHLFFCVYFKNVFQDAVPGQDVMKFVAGFLYPSKWLSHWLEQGYGPFPNSYRLILFALILHLVTFSGDACSWVA